MAAINPLPSLIRASAWDAANMSMRKAGRKKWSRADYNAAACTQERLIRACYGRPIDEPESPWPFIRFGIAERAEQEGKFTLTSDFQQISAAIDKAIAA